MALKQILTPKDKRASIFYTIALLMLWQLGTTLRNLCTDVYAQLSTQNNPIFSFVVSKNTGAAFSILSSHTTVLIVLSSIAFIFLSVYMYKKVAFYEKTKIVSITLFCAGIFGNLYERITLGYVIDYIKLNFVNFAVFNTYDIMICAAVFIYTLSLIKQEIALKKGKNEENSSN